MDHIHFSAYKMTLNHLSAHNNNNSLVWSSLPVTLNIQTIVVVVTYGCITSSVSHNNHDLHFYI